MDLLEALTGVAFVGALLLLILLVTIIGPRSGDADSLFRSPTDLGWPRGVQEEEPLRWRVELLGRSRPTEAGLDSNGPAS
ncbi:MAG TPA: hypothetical protein VFW02_07230 [Candidatus Limnocylindrales bacterium]|nr:hypothetical protein [Candidatus Limnocylindrales bacterium]